MLERDLQVALLRERAHGLTRVYRLPAVREDERQIQFGMQEALALEHPLGGILADQDAVEPAQEVVPATGDGGLRRPRDLTRPLLRLHGALRGGRVRVEEARHAPLLAQPFEPQLGVPLEGRQEVGQRLRLVARLGGHLLADAIRLQLLAAAVAREDPPARHRDGGGHQVSQRPGNQRARQQAGQSQQARPRGAGLALGVVAGGHVYHLVGDHVGEFVLAVRDGEQPPRDIDVAAG